MLEVSKNHPGLVATVYARAVRADRLDEFVAHVQKFDVPGYKAVRPQGNRPISVPILYIEPADERNLSALGFDLYSDPVRMAALETARDTGEAALLNDHIKGAGCVRRLRPGLAMYFPVYERAWLVILARLTRAVRHCRFSCRVRGFRINDLLAALGGDRQRLPDFKIFDAELRVDTPLAQSRVRGEFAHTEIHGTKPALISVTGYGRSVGRPPERPG